MLITLGSENWNRMSIPPRLKLGPVSDSDSVFREMSELCRTIEEELEAGSSVDDLLQQWHRHAPGKYEPKDFQTYWKAISRETFVRDALNPTPSFDNDVTYAEALAVVGAISDASIRESETGYYLGWLEAQFPGSDITDLIYWPDEWFDDPSLFRDSNGKFKPESDLSNDQILAYAMAKSGRKLRGAPEGIVLPFPIPGKA